MGYFVWLGFDYGNNLVRIRVGVKGLVTVKIRVRVRLRVKVNPFWHSIPVEAQTKIFTGIESQIGLGKGDIIFCMSPIGFNPLK